MVVLHDDDDDLTLWEKYFLSTMTWTCSDESIMCFGNTSAVKSKRIFFLKIPSLAPLNSFGCCLINNNNTVAWNYFNYYSWCIEMFSFHSVVARCTCERVLNHNRIDIYLQHLTVGFLISLARNDSGFIHPMLIACSLSS